MIKLLKKFWEKSCELLIRFYNSDFYRSIFTSEKFVYYDRVDRVKDKYNVHVSFQGKDSDEMVLMLEPKDGEYLFGEMDDTLDGNFKQRVSKLTGDKELQNYEKMANDNSSSYFLVMDDQIIEESEDLFENVYKICDVSFGTVYAKQGMNILNKILEEHEERYLGKFHIKNDKGNKVSFDDFSSMLESSQVIWE